MISAPNNCSGRPAISYRTCCFHTGSGPSGILSFRHACAVLYSPPTQGIILDSNSFPAVYVTAESLNSASMALGAISRLQHPTQLRGCYDKVATIAAPWTTSEIEQRHATHCRFNECLREAVQLQKLQKDRKAGVMARLAPLNAVLILYL